MSEEFELIKKKLQYYLDENKLVHISKTNGRFHNGSIKYIGADFVILNDLIKEETIAFFVEIQEVEPYKSRGGADETN